ncbi:hypothetical protein CLV24_12364 [Pontibacter ummariensis]|uniref:Uncharacterized protein n=1 Tax=Pontibacter ummariensis TaxID=1610492 RepID=A0A239JT07_9BACT|nr:hypothetical protein [Pontibacter ummariensis]PRY07415.1 hypothetical protein CLV24_12364 [Pontibacter ummariensis]SNT08889.1 hypothetical protein SAMN06296052_12364 [Pontibacter ummariensis]
MTEQKKQPWLQSPLVDGLFILSPPFLCLLAIMLFPGFFQTKDNAVSVTAWVLLILLIDVGHVWSTLFRTYFDKERLRQQKQLLLWVPVLAWLGGMLLHSLGGLVFWRVLAYLAVYHFVRQQYGFLRLYSRQEKQSQLERQIDTITVYVATIYPLLYWHLEGNRRFNWFLENDFYFLSQPGLLPLLTGMYLLVLAIYLLKEVRRVWRNKYLNLPRNLVILGTLLSWYLGIVYYNGDLIFTTFNVVSHGIPYMASVWIFGKRKYRKAGATAGLAERLAFGAAGIAFFLGLVFLLAYVEEGLWDALVWRDHESVFSLFTGLPIIEDELLLTVLVPLLALPQLTHYILDGFIWKVSREKDISASL